MYESGAFHCFFLSMYVTPLLGSAFRISYKFFDRFGLLLYRVAVFTADCMISSTGVAKRFALALVDMCEQFVCVLRKLAKLQVFPTVCSHGH
jgi:hypothetical protein